jgi:hypothetical protein
VSGHEIGAGLDRTFNLGRASMKGGARDKSSNRLELNGVKLESSIRSLEK